MNIERAIAITAWENPDRIQSIVDSLSDEDHIVIYMKKDSPNFKDIQDLHVHHLNIADVVAYPDDIDTEVKTKNFVISEMKKKGVKKLHMLEDNVSIIKNPHPFMDDIENLLSLLGLNSFLGTVTDDCNFVYNKYVPRLRIHIDDELKGWKEKLKIDEVVFCSHSNTYWMYFDLEHADEDELHFEEAFKSQMYWIIEYLARRRNKHPNTMYFMNQYVTCASERGTYERAKIEKNVSKEEAEKVQKEFIENMKADHEIFTAMAVDNHPDCNQNIVVERLYKILSSKIDK